MLSFVKNDFSGGFNLKIDPTKLEAEEYHLLLNARNRNGNIDPVSLPEEITGQLPSGKVQGCYSAGNYLFVFVSGICYYKDYNITTGTFTPVVGLAMSSTVDVIYVELVPASTVNYGRSLSAADNKSSPVYLGTSTSASPVCAVVQDGINQPWVIFPDGTARVTKTYAQWENTETGREYVPIGTLMLFYDSILYVVGKTPGSPTSSPTNQIFRSVSGRPLDFMVAIDTNGDKTSASELIGGAPAVAHQVDFDTVTCMQLANSVDGSFFVSTSKRSYLVKPDYTSLLFGEPTFSNTPLFNTGCLNNFGLVNVIGDITFIDFTGLRSFNAALQARYEGRNLPFSAKVYPLFQDIVQDVSCAAQFDNYAFYAVTTKFGFGVVVFDTITNTFVALDQFSNLSGKIRMFAEVKTTTARKLFFISDDNKIYEWGAGTTAPVSFYPQEWTNQQPNTQHRAVNITLLFNNVTEDGTVTLTPYVDRVSQNSLDSTLVASSVPIPNPQPFPFVSYSSASIVPVNFTLLQNSLEGYKLGYTITWNCRATLVGIELNTQPTEHTSGSFAQEAKLWRNI